MATYVAGTVTVGNTATPIASPGDCLTMLVQNGAAVVFLGGANVATSGANAGVQVAVNGSTTVPVSGDAQATLYGICATSTTVSYLYVV